MTKADRDLGKLDPDFKNKVDLWLKENPEIFVTEAWRSEKRQFECIQSGASKVKRSLHQDGLAVDLGFRGKELYPTDQTKWRKVADSAKKYGIDWGYDLWKWDMAHWQDNGKKLLTKNMTEQEKKALDAAIAVLSSLWYQLPDDGKIIAQNASVAFKKLL